MKKYNYILLIEGILKVVVSTEPMPEQNALESNADFINRYNKWFSDSDKFDIADKENEDNFLLLAGCPESPEGSDFEVKLKQGILIPAENVEIRMPMRSAKLSA